MGSAAGSAAPLISAVIVHYRTPRLLEAAVAALRADARASALDLEVVVVDNGAAGAGASAERLDPARLEAQVLAPASNLGYAGGVNRGVERSSGDILLLMNADVVVEAGCLRALAGALYGADIAGPRLFWDQGRRLMLPPQQVRTRAAELDAALAERSAAWGRSYRRRWRRRVRPLWRASEPTPCFELTGAALAVTRDAWRRVGAFDDGFQLYFEETDWLLRARRMGCRAVLAPAARAVHAYDQSAQREPRSQLWFEESAERFRRRWYGGWFASLLRRLERTPRRFADPSPLRRGSGGEAWAEVTPLPLGVPAAGCRLGAEDPAGFELPADVARGARSELWVRASDADCRDLGGRLERVASPA